MDSGLLPREDFSAAPLSDDGVDQMLMLAERLKTANGGVLDDAAVQAVAEATGAPVEYVRLAVKLRAEKHKTGAVGNVRAQFLTLDPDTRRLVLIGTTATICALLTAIENRLGTVVSNYGVLSMLGILAVTVGLYGVATSKDNRYAMVGGAILGGGFFAMYAVFAMILQVKVSIEPVALVPVLLGSAVGGFGLYALVSKYRRQLGLKDPIKERQQLLSQLVELQDKLRSGEKSMTFLSVDIVGSTRMKEQADPLSVEFTFNEYHQFVDRITRKYGGRVHSTAGDGVTCAFDHPQQAFGAARTIQTGLIELNTFRNKIGTPIRLRCGVHTGTVVAPDGEDVTSVNFSHVIDIAAHIQKVSPVGGVAVSDAAAMFIPGGTGTVGTERVSAMDVAGTIWQPKAVAESVGTGNPPPAPQPG